MNKKEFEEKRKKLVEAMCFSGAIETPAVKKAFLAVPREEFFREEEKGLSYIDSAFSIGHGQTISQPSTIAIMLELLGVKKGNKILEIGSGSGYVLALLSELVGAKGKIFGVELIPELMERSRITLQNLGYKNIKMIQGDGTLGWKENAPFDRAIFSAACPKIPAAVIKQLKPRGRIVAPVGRFMQLMHVLEKDAKGNISEWDSGRGPFMFVPLKGEEGF